MGKLVAVYDMTIFFFGWFKGVSGEIVVANEHPFRLERGEKGIIHREEGNLAVPLFEDPGADWGCAQPHPSSEVAVRLKGGHYVKTPFMGRHYTEDRIFRGYPYQVPLDVNYSDMGPTIVRVESVTLKIAKDFERPKVVTRMPQAAEVFIDLVKEQDRPGDWTKVSVNHKAEEAQYVEI